MDRQVPGPRNIFFCSPRHYAAFAAAEALVGLAWVGGVRCGKAPATFLPAAPD